MKLPPASVVLSWPQPNYVNPQTRGHALTILNGVFLALATVAIVLRLYTRLFVRKWFGLDDIFICLAFACTVALNAIVDIGSSQYGWNRHTWDIPLSMASMSLKYAYIAKMLFLCASWTTAFSLLSFYYRLVAESGSHWFRWALHLALLYNFVGFLPFLFAQIFVCVPIQAYWMFPEPSGTYCVDEGKATLAGGIIKTSMDLIITTLPIPFVLRTNMQKRQKYGVAVLFGLGYIVTAAGAVRTYYTYVVFYKTYDQTWWQYPAFLASTVENNLAIICACIPTIRPLFPYFFGGPVSRLRGWLSKSSTSSPPDSFGKLSFNATPPINCRPRMGPNSRLSRILYSSHNLTLPSEYDARDESDLKLVIQKHDAPSGTEMDDLAFETVVAHTKEDSKLTRTRSHSTSRPRTHSRSHSQTLANGNLNPFDPRWDHHDVG